MDRDYLNKILRTKPLTAMQYRILLTLMTGEYTKAQLAEAIGVSQQSIHPVCKQLLELDLIEIVKTVGRNQYLACKSSVILADNKSYNRELEDALELFDKFKTFDYDAISNMDNSEFSKYANAILLICKKELYTVSSLLIKDSFFSDLLNCEDDDITSSLENIKNNFSVGDYKNSTNWSYHIGNEYCINVEYTFVNKDITSDYIDFIKKELSDHEVWEKIVNEDVRITNIRLI